MTSLIDVIPHTKLQSVSFNGFSLLQESIVLRALGPVMGSHLGTLVLTNCELTDKEAAILAMSARSCVGLCSLDLSSNQITVVGASCLVRCCCWVESASRGLRELVLSNNNITGVGKGAAPLCRSLLSCEAEYMDPDYDFESNSRQAKLTLTSLNLSHNDLKAIGVSQLVPFLGSPGPLRKLNLSYTNMGSQGLEALCRQLSPMGTRLTDLDLSGNNLLSGGGYLRRVVEQMSCLCVLELHHAGLDEGDGTAIERGLANNFNTAVLLTRGNQGVGSKALLDILRISTENTVFHTVDNQMIEHAGGVRFERQIAVLITGFLFEGGEERAMAAQGHTHFSASYF